MSHWSLDEQKVLRATDEASDVIGLFDLDGKPLWVNAAGEYLRDPEVTKQDPFGHVHPEDRERVRTEYMSVARTGQPRRLEFRVPQVDGSNRLVQSEATAVRDGSGKVVAVLRIGRNVTEERRDDAALKATMEALLEQAPIGISVTDLEGRFLGVNRRMREIGGLTDEDVATRNVWEFTYGADKARTEALVDDLVSGRIDHFALEKRIVRTNGEIRWVSCSAGIVRPPLGERRFVIEFADDITARKGVDDALREREKLLEAIFDYAPIGISITDADGRFVRVNRSLQSMLGYTEEELARMTVWDVLPSRDIDENRRVRDDLWRGVKTKITVERRYNRKNGETLWAQNTVSLIRDAAGRPQFVMALAEDIRERRLAHAALQATAEKLQALTRQLVDLQETERRHIARELHDRVGQTLTAMRINMDMIRTRLAAHEDALIRARNDDSLELIQSAFKAVEDVLHELRPPMIDEFGLVPALRWHAERFAERMEIEVQVRGDEESRCEPSVELALFRIAQEALNNVARHAQARHVDIEVRTSETEVVLAIEDDGVGFELDARKAALGYGLITMRERAEAVGGTFEAQAGKGIGTRIRVRSPCRS